MAAAPAADAQEAADRRETLKIEVTGTNIPRIDGETTLPVQIITREEILRSGLTTAAQVMAQVPANFGGFSDALSIGNASQPGLASANLRGIGDGSTLVLLNGRRVANYAFNGATVDLNSIPLANIDRIEILKDGASAIYGSDAIAGVVNFILRQDFTGVEITGYGSVPEHRGGDAWQGTLTVGYGDLAADRFNAFITVDYQSQQSLHARDRPFSRTAYLPQQGVNGLDPRTFPGSIFDHGRLLNPTLASGCAPPVSLPYTFRGQPTCGYDFASQSDLTPPVDRTNIIGRLTWQATPTDRLFADYNQSHNRFMFRVAPAPVLVRYPADGPYYPAAFAGANGISDDLTVAYRAVALGPRTNSTTTDANRLVFGAEGTFGAWSYSTAANVTESKATDAFTRGYLSRQALDRALATGLVNPFGPSGAEGTALLVDAQVIGDGHFAKGTTRSLDARFSRDVYALPAGPLAVALGAETRWERLDNRFIDTWTSGDVVGFAGDQQSVTGSRNVTSAFAELNVPVISTLEAQLAARYDHYSDFGSTVNPKVSLRWQPLKTLLVRGSWGTGYRAPSLPDLYTPLTRSHSPLDLSDPVRCPVTNTFEDCGAGFTEILGGDVRLQPEKSSQYTVGLVFEPAPGISASADYWNIRKKNVIGSLPGEVILANLDRFGASNVIRGPIEAAYPGLPGPILALIETNANISDVRTSGVDVDLRYRGEATAIGRIAVGFAGTYTIDFEDQLQGFQGPSSVGVRWRHHVALDWLLGAWSVTLAETYSSSYRDANLDAARKPRDVSAYDVWDLQARYTGVKDLTVALGVLNLMDCTPPFSNQTRTFQVGYDPSYANPLGRTFYARLTYMFH